jgi:GDPmannose 4,6-dehydratase
MTTKRALVTGITGQDGTYLAELLVEKGYEVAGLIRGQANPKRAMIEQLLPKVEIVEGDLTDMSSLISALERVQPDEVYNLAAVSFVALSFNQPELTGNITGLGALRVLEAIRIVNSKIRFYQASSSEMFGKVREVPQTELTPFHPRSPYGVAKVYAHYMTVNYRESYGMHASSGICFNHESVPEHTPIVIRRDGFVDVVPIGEVVPHRADPSSGTHYVSDGGGYDIWDGTDWVSCTARTAYWYEGDSVVTHGRAGIVESTPDHVIFLESDERPAQEIVEGDRLKLAERPQITSFTTMTEDEAWLLGILTAEGYVAERGSGRITCRDDAVLAEAATCWERVAAGSWRKTEGAKSAFGDSRTPSLELHGNPAYLRMIRDELYCADGQKRIPKRILNASSALQLAFLTAYNLGDGLKAGNGTDVFKSFRTVSPVLAAGLVWLAQSVLGRRVAVYLQPGALGGGSSYLINLTSGRVRGATGAHLRKEPSEVRKVERVPFKGWMFDVATDSGRFAAGVGLVVVHNSPRRGYEFVTRKISSGVARISLGLADHIVLGNLEAKRDWGYAGDFVEGMWMMTQQPEADDFVLATGETHSIREFLDLAFREIGIEDWSGYVKQDPRFLRPAEVDHLVGDASKARTKLGWTPKVSFPELVARMVRADLEGERR